MSAEEEQPITVLLSRVMETVGAVKKGERNKHQGFDFRGIDAVINALSPALRKHGVVITPELVSVEHTDISTTKGNAMNRALVVVKYTLHGPKGDSITVSAPGESFDSGDKATAKAMSVAMRTAMLQTFALPTDETDPDQCVYNGTPTAAPQQQAPALSPQQAMQNAWQSLQGMTELKAWAENNQAPADYMNNINTRIAALQQQQTDAQRTGGQQ